MKSLNRVELVLGGIILFIFTIWSFGKCSSLSKYKQQAPVEQTTPAAQDATNQQNTTNNNPTATPQATSAQPTKQPVAPVQTQPTRVIIEDKPTVYVIVEGLKLRDKPGLSGTKVLGQLPLNTSLLFLGQQTEYKDKITIGEVTYNEPWIKVKTKDSAFEGWVFGGGVRPYKN